MTRITCGKLRIAFAVFLLWIIRTVTGSPITLLDACIQNCAQCQETLDVYFNGKLCADTCLKFNGKTIPDCESFDSVSPFLVKIA